MLNNNHKAQLEGKWLILVVILVFLLFALEPIAKLLIVKKKIDKAPNVVVEQSVPENQVLNGEIVKKTRVERGGDYLESIFFIGDQEIARQRIVKGEVVEHKGEEINGEVSFTNDLDQTYGKETYQNNRRQGQSITYFPDGKVMLKEDYSRGILTASREYYSSGKIRFDLNYYDALNCKDMRESGVGKLYYPSGILKYEWNLSSMKGGGFKKAYYTDGSLRLESTYNSQCEVVETKTFSPKQ